jgi:hypothetical protein
VRHVQLGHGRRRSPLRRWLVHLRYTIRGNIDGRRGLPLVSADGAQRTPTLHRLAEQVAVEVETIQAQATAATSEARVAVAQLEAPGGVLARAQQRLQSMQERLDEVIAAGVETGRRFGEETLPEELVAARREREHDRRVRRARKRVEDERTVLSGLLAEQQRLVAGIEQEVANAAARTRLVGRSRRAHSTSYLNGALGKHPDRPLLTTFLPELAPVALASATATGPARAREELS